MGALNSLMRLPFTIFSTIFAVLHKLFLYGIIRKELYYPYKSSQESFKRLFFCLRELMQWNMCKKKAFRILPIMNSWLPASDINLWICKLFIKSQCGL